MMDTYLLGAYLLAHIYCAYLLRISATHIC